MDLHTAARLALALVGLLAFGHWYVGYRIRQYHRAQWDECTARLAAEIFSDHPESAKGPGAPNAGPHHTASQNLTPDDPQGKA